jgi:hypothetical protein
MISKHLFISYLSTAVFERNNKYTLTVHIQTYVCHGFHVITLFAVVVAFTTISLESSEMSSSNCMCKKEGGGWREREREWYLMMESL